jgi:ABC-type sugar transport system substrate-binding protein
MSDDRRSPAGFPADRSLSRREILRWGAVGGLGLVGLAGCGSNDAAPSGASTTAKTSTGAAAAAQKLSGLSHDIPGVVSIDAVDRGFQWAAEQLGGTARLQAYDGDLQKQLSQVRQFKALGMNGVTSYLVSDASTSQYVGTLAKDKIAYFNYSNRVAWTSPVDPKYNGYFIASSNGSFAEETYLSAKAMFERGGGEGEAVLLRGVKGGVSDQARCFGIFLALKEYPKIKIVAEAYTDWDRNKAKEQMQALIPAHPKVRFVCAANDSIALGAMASLRAVNRSDVYYMGADGDVEFMENMVKDDHVVATSAGVLTHTGVLAAVWLFDFLNGVKLTPLESWLNTDSVVVDTAEAAQAMIKLIGKKGDPLPYDARKMSRFLQGDKWQMPHRLEVADPANFDWGNKPGTAKRSKPAGFAWPDAYQKALDAGDLKRLREDYKGRMKDDVYGTVREKATRKEGVLGTFEKMGLTS